MSGDSLAVQRLAIERFRGFEGGGFRLDDLARGINLVHGPNASGKSTTARALAELLWPDAEPVPRRRLAARLEIGGAGWEIDLDHGHAAYRREGAPSPPPPLPPADVRDRYHLALGALLAAEAREDGFASAIAREAAGGYDLEAAAAALGAKERATGGRAQASRMRDAAAEVRRIEEEQRRLAVEAGELGELRAQADAAREAAVEVARLDRVLAWRDAREQRLATEARLGTFPPALASLTGRERAELAELRGHLADAEERRAAMEERWAEARRRIAAAALPAAGVPADLLVALREGCGRLRELAAEAGRCGRALAEARARQDRAARSLGAALGGTADEAALAALIDRPAVGEWQELVDLARRAESLHAEEARLADEAAALAALTARGDLADVEGEAAPTSDPAFLERSVRLLRAWLGFPERPVADRLAGAIAAVLVAAAGAAAALRLHPGFWALAGVGVVLLAWIVGDARRVLGARRRVGERHAELPVAQPPRWQCAQVAETLASAEDAWLAARAQQARERERAERHGEVDRAQARLGELRRALGRDREELLGRLGISPGAPGGPNGPNGPNGPGAPQVATADAPLVLFAQALAGWREAGLEVAAHEAALGQVEAESRAALAAAGERLAAYGYPQPADLDAALGAVEALTERARAHREAAPVLAELEDEGGERQRIAERLAELAAKRAAVYRRAGVGAEDDAALDRLLEQLPRYREVVAQADRERGVEERDRSRLEPGDEPLRDRPRAELEAERDRLATDAAKRDELFERIHRLEGSVDAAKRKRDLEGAQAAAEEARRALGEERDREAEAVLTRLLVDWLREETGTLSRPAVLRSAEATFARITRGRFELQEPRGVPPRFRARETVSGRVRDLAELSEGVRMQLLMAVRLAFIEHREEGLRLPLVLDHSLATADPEAEREVIGAVIELARLGRQIFYFTPRPETVELWREAVAEAADPPTLQVVDLRAVRRLAEAERAPLGKAAPRRPQVPPPAGRDRREYGKALAVPGLDPRGEPAAIHLWHLVADGEELHRLLSRGIDRWGELQALLRSGENGLLESGLRRRIEARGRCVEVLFHAWRLGRGRPVDRAALDASGAVTVNFLEEVAVLVSDCDDDAARVVAGLRSGRVKRFRSDKIDQLEEYLVERGYLDESDVLGRDGLRERALTALADEIAAGLLDPLDIDELLAQIPDLG